MAVTEPSTPFSPSTDPEAAVVLLVDDEPTNLQLAATILRRSGCDIIFAASGPEALEAAMEDPPDVILLDIMMPGMDGYEVCRRLKDDPQTASIPVIFLTARSEEDDIVHGFSLGAADYLTKPVRPRELLARVQTQTRLKQAETELVQTNEKLKEVNRNQNTFFRIIAHDLSRPFTGFKSLTQLLQQDAGDLKIADLTDIFDELRVECERTQQLLDNLYQWANLNLDRADFHPRPLKLRNAAEAAAQQHGSSVKAKKQSLAIEIPQDLRVFADPEMLVSVYGQLIANALEYTSSEGHITLDAKVLPDTGMVEATVTDDGIGMSQEQLENLFRVEKVRLHKQPNDAGAGLGLVLTRGFIRKQGGQIRVESTEGEGTRVIFTLPLAESD